MATSEVGEQQQQAASSLLFLSVSLQVLLTVEINAPKLDYKHSI